MWCKITATETLFTRWHWWPHLHSLSYFTFYFQMWNFLLQIQYATLFCDHYAMPPLASASCSTVAVMTSLVTYVTLQWTMFRLHPILASGPSVFWASTCVSSTYTVAPPRTFWRIFYFYGVNRFSTDLERQRQKNWVAVSFGWMSRRCLTPACSQLLLLIPLLFCLNNKLRWSGSYFW